MYLVRAAAIPHHSARDPVLSDGQKLQLHGGGHSVRSFIHIKDVADGTLRVMHSAPAGEIYHFSTTRNISIGKSWSLSQKSWRQI